MERNKEGECVPIWSSLAFAVVSTPLILSCPLDSGKPGARIENALGWPTTRDSAPAQHSAQASNAQLLCARDLRDGEAAPSPASLSSGRPAAWFLKATPRPLGYLSTVSSFPTSVHAPAPPEARLHHVKP